MSDTRQGNVHGSLAQPLRPMTRKQEKLFLSMLVDFRRGGVKVVIPTHMHVRRWWEDPVSVNDFRKLEGT